MFTINAPENKIKNVCNIVTIYLSWNVFDQQFLINSLFYQLVKTISLPIKGISVSYNYEAVWDNIFFCTLHFLFFFLLSTGTGLQRLVWQFWQTCRFDMYCGVAPAPFLFVQAPWSPALRDEPFSTSRERQLSFSSSRLHVILLSLLFWNRAKPAGELEEAW